MSPVICLAVFDETIQYYRVDCTTNGAFSAHFWWPRKYLKLNSCALNVRHEKCNIPIIIIIRRGLFFGNTYLLFIS